MLFPRTQFQQSLRSWRFYLAIAVVLFLLALSVISVVRQWESQYIYGDNWPCIDLIFIAALYFLALFFYLPESVGATPSATSRPIPERWQAFVLLTIILELLALTVFYAIVILQNASYIFFPVAIPLILACTSLLPIAVAASGSALELTSRLPGPSRPGSLCNRLQSFVIAWGHGPINRLGFRSSLLVGAVLILLSLWLPLAGGLFFSRTGFDVIGGGYHLVFPDVASFTGNRLYDLLFRAFYLLGLALALAALAALLVPGLVRAQFVRRILVTVVALVSMFEFSITLSSDYPNTPFVFGSRLVLGLVPVLVWVFSSWFHSPQAALPTRLFLVLLFLPLLAFWIFPLTVRAYFTPGYGAFTFGLLFLWWGFLERLRPASRTP